MECCGYSKLFELILCMKTLSVVSDFIVTFCRTLSKGTRGEVYEVNGDRAAVILEMSDEKIDDVSKGDNEEKKHDKPRVYWIDGIISSRKSWFSKQILMSSSAHVYHFVPVMILEEAITFRFRCRTYLVSTPRLHIFCFLIMF